MLDSQPLEVRKESAQAKGNLQGRDVRVQPHAQHITPAPAQKTAPTSDPSLGLRQARPTNAPAGLVRQARYGALPSATQLLLPSAGAAQLAQAKGLPSISQLVASAGHVRSDTLLERFLNLFSGGTSSADYQNILTGLEKYHDACQTGTGQDAQTRLDDLTQQMDRYSRGNDRNEQRAGIIEDLRRHISTERSTLASLVADLEDSPLAPGATLSHALAFTREGVPLKEMTRLINSGLKLDKAQEARKILDGEKMSAAYEAQPPGYLGVLADLENYHAACASHSIAADAPSNIRSAEQATALLEKLYTSTTDALPLPGAEQKTDPRTEAFRGLHSQISTERQVLQGLLDELANGGALPEGANLSHAMAFAREGVSLHDMARLMGKGLLPSQAADARMLLDSERGTGLMDMLHRSTPEQRALLTKTFNEGELLLLELSGLGIEGGQAYKHLGIPITRQTIVTEYADQQRIDDMTILGAGACNTVFATRYSGADGVVTGIFKPMKNLEKGAVAHYIGIDRHYPQIANRNLATQDLARALGFDVLVDCRIGSHRDPQTKELQIGVVMDRAPGQAACKASRQHYTHPEVRREITKLQLLDHLTGQADRHANNYFIHVYQDERGQTKVKVSGIDNDQCFGKDTKSGDDIRKTERDDGFFGTRMPQLIDTDMAAALRSLTPERLDTMLSDKLSPDEVKAAHSRLKSLQQHVGRLEANKQVITPTQWNAQALASPLQAKDNSYFVRDAGSSVNFWATPSPP